MTLHLIGCVLLERAVSGVSGQLAVELEVLEATYGDIVACSAERQARNAGLPRQAQALRGRASTARGHDHAALQPAGGPGRGAPHPGAQHPPHLRTLSLDSGVHAEIVSDRVGHAHEGITVQIDGHRSTGHDREAAELVAGLIRRKLDVGPTADAG